MKIEELIDKGDQTAQLVQAALNALWRAVGAERRDQLLAFADDFGLQLFVSSPDQDGVKREIRHSVSLIVVKAARSRFSRSGWGVMAHPVR